MSNVESITEKIAEVVKDVDALSNLTDDEKEQLRTAQDNLTHALLKKGAGW
jgi:hypothetical protein